MHADGLDGRENTGFRQPVDLIVGRAIVYFGILQSASQQTPRSASSTLSCQAHMENLGEPGCAFRLLHRLRHLFR